MLNRRTIKSELCVVGGGLAGMCAAIAAARHGIRTVLMHERAVLGGNASSEIRMWVCGASGDNNRETGIIEEIMLENLRRNPTKNYYIWDTVLYEFVKRETNITLLLNCTCMDAAYLEGDFDYGRDRRITRLTGYQMTTQTFFDIEADYYADCSGDSVTAPLTGAQFRYGRESADEFGEKTSANTADKKTMGMSCLIEGRESTKKTVFIAPDWTTKLSDEDIINRKPKIGRTGENFWYLELGGNQNCIDDTEEIRDKLIPLALGMWDHIKNSGMYQADKWELEFLGFLPGKRESRRMVGEYIITEPDISSGTQFDDTVAYGGWPLDDHHPDGFYHRGRANTNYKTPSPYPIPYRALYSKNVENLFFAGRNISMTHMAMSSIRVMGTCALLGQAVGTAVSVAVRHKISPHSVYLDRIDELQEALMRDDCFLPYKKRKISEVCRSTNIINGDARLKDGCDRPNPIYGTIECGIEIKNGGYLEYRFNKAQKIGSVHIVFDSDLNRKTLPGDRVEQVHATRANVLLDSPDNFSLPKTLCRSFSLLGVTGENEEILISVDNNSKRAYDIDVNRCFNALKLIIFGNWGDDGFTRVFSFDFN